MKLKLIQILSPLRYRFNVQVKLADLNGAWWLQLAPLARSAMTNVFRRSKRSLFLMKGIVSEYFWPVLLAISLQPSWIGF